MTRRRRYQPKDESTAIGVMAQMRDLMLSEAQLDRAVAAFKSAEAVIATGRAAGLDRSADERLLEDRREEIRGLE